MVALRTDVFVMLILFETDGPAQQTLLIDGVCAEVERWVAALPGFVASAFHRGEDGRHVVSYAQWRSRADWEAFAQQPQQADIGARIKAAGARPIHGGAYGPAQLIEPPCV